MPRPCPAGLQEMMQPCLLYLPLPACHLFGAAIPAPPRPGGLEEMMQPCQLHLRANSLIGSAAVATARWSMLRGTVKRWCKPCPLYRHAVSFVRQPPHTLHSRDLSLSSRRRSSHPLASSLHLHDIVISSVRPPPHTRVISFGAAGAIKMAYWLGECPPGAVCPNKAGSLATGKV